MKMQIHLLASIIVLFMLIPTAHVFSQGVGIGTTTPNAQLELESTLANRKIILYERFVNDHQYLGFGINPGIMRYQVSDLFDNHVFYAGVDSSYSNELMRITGQGRVGIGVSNPRAQLHLASSLESRKIILHESGDNDHQFLGFGINPYVMRYQVAEPIHDHVFFSGIDSLSSRELLRIKGNGNVGIGTSSPDAQLELGSTIANRKIILYEDGVNDHQFLGFGTYSSGMRYQISFPTDNHVFYSGASSSSSNELMRITGQGRVGIGTSSPSAQLELGSTLAKRKLILFKDFDNDHQFSGFGVDSAVTRYQVADLGNSHVFYAGTSASTSNELMRIKGNGNVGFGVSSPTNTIDLQRGTVRTGTHATGIPMYITGDMMPAAGGAEFRHHDGSQGIGIGYNTIYAAGSNADQNLNIAAKGASGNVALISNGIERLKITGAGNLGLGVATPLNTLDIHRGTARSNTHSSDNALYVTGGVEFRSADASIGVKLSSNDILASGNNTNIDLALAGKGASGNITFKTNGVERARITGTGIGIGTTAPNAPLQFSSSNANRKIVLNEVAINDHQFSGLGTSTGILRYQISTTTDHHVFYAGANGTTSNELMRITGVGRVGIGGVTNPNAELQLTNALANRKFILYEGTQNDHQFFGFGINPGILRYQVAATADNHVFYAGSTTTTSNELMRIQGNGYVGIGNIPTNKLDVGSGRTGTHSTDRALYVTSDEFTEFNDPVMEIRSIDGVRGMGFAWNSIFPTGTLADQPITLKSKGATAIFFETNGLEKMRIASSGIVAIGMAGQNAQNWIDINTGSGNRTGTHPTSLAMYVTGNLGASSAGVEFRHKDGTQGIGFGYNTMYASGSNTSQDLNLAAKGTSGNLTLYTNGLERFKITGDGNLGLGVTSPINTLDVHRGTARTNTHNGGNALYVTGGAEFRSADATTGLRIGSNNIFASGSGTNVDLSLAGKGSTGSITFKTNDIERVRITGAGIGIGTTSPNSPLQFSNASENRKIVLAETAFNNHEYYGFGVNGNALRYQTDQPASDHVFYSAINATSSRELIRIKGNGNVGIGNNNPMAPLHFSNTAANRKIVLSGGTNNDHQFAGFGTNVDGALRFQTAETADDHIFYTGLTATTSDELFRIKSTTGNVSLKGVIENETMQSPTLVNGFTNYGNGYGAPGFYKDKEGKVWLSGLVDSANDPDNLTMFTLPVGYRPLTGTLIFTVINNAGTCRVDVLTDGTVKVNSGAAGWISLDQIYFRAN